MPANQRGYLSTLFFLFFLPLVRTRNILDDFREAYYWLRQNTDEHARVMSWWDYGYQIAGMANRTTLVDNNTWNNSHIALVRAVIVFLVFICLLPRFARGSKHVQRNQWFLLAAAGWLASSSLIYLFLNVIAILYKTAASNKPDNLVSLNFFLLNLHCREISVICCQILWVWFIRFSSLLPNVDKCFCLLLKAPLAFFTLTSYPMPVVSSASVHRKRHQSIMHHGSLFNSSLLSRSSAEASSLVKRVKLS